MAGAGRAEPRAVARALDTSAVTVHERLAAKKHLMAQPFPHARFPHPLANEGSVTGLRPRPLLAELAEQPVGLQPWRGGLLSNHRPIAAPRPIARVPDHPGAHGVQHHVPRKLQKVGVALDENGLEPTLEEVRCQPWRRFVVWV